MEEEYPIKLDDESLNMNDRGGWSYECPNCNKLGLDEVFKFCPYCGVKITFY